VSRVCLFIDEQGDVKFGPTNSTHFGLGAIATDDPTRLTMTLDTVRHDMWSEGHVHRGSFHAQGNCIPVKRRVFESFAAAPILSCDVVALRKEYVWLDLRDPAGVYRMALRFLLRAAIPRFAAYDELSIVAAEWPLIKDLTPLLRAAASVGSGNHPVLWTKALNVMQAPAAHHGGLQYADYLTWANKRLRVDRQASWIELTRLQGRASTDNRPFET